MTQREKLLVAAAALVALGIGIPEVMRAFREPVADVSKERSTPRTRGSSTAATRPGKAPAKRSTKKDEVAKIAAEASVTPILRLDLLARRELASADIPEGRNVFTFPPPPPPPPTPPTAAELALKDFTTKKCPPPCPLSFGETYGPPPPPPPKPPDPPPPPPPKPVPPAIPYKFLGVFGPDEHPIAAFMNGKEILNGRVGDILEEKFVVRKVSLDSVEFGFVGFPDDETRKVALSP